MSSLHMLCCFLDYHGEVFPFIVIIITKCYVDIYLVDLDFKGWLFFLIDFKSVGTSFYFFHFDHSRGLWATNYLVNISAFKGKRFGIFPLLQNFLKR